MIINQYPGTVENLEVLLILMSNAPLFVGLKLSINIISVDLKIWLLLMPLVIKGLNPGTGARSVQYMEVPWHAGKINKNKNEGKKIKINKLKIGVPGGLAVPSVGTQSRHSIPALAHTPFNFH